MINIKSDSRKVKKGDIFIALRGISSDGHDYIDKAIENGASKLVVEEGEYNIPYETVSNTRDYLNKYLKENYKKYLDSMTIIGITGTNGKTTSAYLIYQSLNKLGKKCAYIGTIGYYLDEKVCNLSNTSPDICDIYDMIVNAYDYNYKYIVMEVSSQGLAYNRFNGIEFNYAIFTNLTEDHLDFHKTMDNYMHEKQKLFKQCNGINITNIDDSYSDYFKINKYITYGFNDSNYQVIDYKLNNHSTIFTIKHNNNLIEIKSKLIGKYNIYNMLCAYIILDLLKIDTNDIINVLSSLNSPDGRMNTVKYKDNLVIIDYAHTEDAMENIYNTVKELGVNNIYTVFGCTGSRDRTKRPKMMNLATTNSKYVIITSDDLHEEDFNHIVDDMLENNKHHNYEICENRGKAIKKGINLLKNNDILLILGKGHEEFIIIKNKKIPFNDLKEVNKILNELTIQDKNKTLS